MYRLIRYINQNRRRIILVVVIIVSLIIVIQLLNSFAKKQLDNATKEEKINVSTQNLYQPNKTILTNTTIEETQAKENTQIIEEFVQYCNNNEIQKAYDLLTDECKEVLYPTVDKFNNYYCKKIFTDRKTYNLQSWINDGSNYTYKVRFLENILATGKYVSEAIEDYITIVKNDNNQMKININSYIGRQKMNKEEKNQEITINIISRDIYTEYEEYEIKVTNNRNETILLDSLETVDGIKLIGNSNDIEYQALTNELSNYDVKIPSKNTKIIRIKFSKEYNPRRETNKMYFSNIILNEEDKSSKTTIEVKLK